MIRRECPHCGEMIAVKHEGRAILPDRPPVAVFVEHDPCPGSYQEVDPEPVLVAPDLPPEPRAPRLDYRDDPLGKRSVALLEILSDDKPHPATEMARLTKIPASSVRGALQRLRRRGLVEPHGKGRPQLWRRISG